MLSLRKTHSGYELARFEIRVAQASDAAAVARIYVESWNLGFAGLMPER